VRFLLLLDALAPLLLKAVLAGAVTFGVALLVPSALVNTLVVELLLAPWALALALPVRDLVVAALGDLLAYAVLLLEAARVG
jgi:hypothetical protein